MRQGVGACGSQACQAGFPTTFPQCRVPTSPPLISAEVARIVRHRHVPAPIYKAAKLRRTQMDSERRKTQHRIAHSAPGSVKVKPARKKKVVAELE